MLLNGGVTYGTSSATQVNGSGLVGAVQVLDTNDPGAPTPVVQANILPLQVPIISTPPVTDPNTNTQVTGSSAVPPATAVAAPFSLGSYLGGVLANPGQHLIAVGILLLLAWWFYKHVLKKF